MLETMWAVECQSHASVTIKYTTNQEHQDQESQKDISYKNTYLLILINSLTDLSFHLSYGPKSHH